MRYYIADPHFFHGALNTKMDRRGFESVEAMTNICCGNEPEKCERMTRSLSWGICRGERRKKPMNCWSGSTDACI